MPQYVEGFVIPIKKNKVREYKKVAAWGMKTWMKYGALHYFECVGDEINNNWGRNFTKTLKLKKNETLIFAFIVYKSKAHRNQVNKAVHKDPSMNDFKESSMPFDMKTFTSGGFKVLLGKSKK